METKNSDTKSQNSTITEAPKISILEAVLVVVVSFFITIFVSGALFLLDNPLALVLGELLFLLVPLSFMLFKRVNVKSYVKANFRLKLLATGLGFGIVLLLVNVVVSGILTAIFGTSQAIEEANRTIAELAQTPLGLVSVVLSLSLAGPCEEFLFRGFLQTTINRKYSFWVSVLISAAAFGIAHFDPQLVYMISTFILGIILGYVFRRWNYVGSATAHSTMNVIVLVIFMLTL